MKGGIEINWSDVGRAEGMRGGVCNEERERGGRQTERGDRLVREGGGCRAYCEEVTQRLVINATRVVKARQRLYIILLT